MILSREHYGLKSTGATNREKLEKHFNSIGYKSSEKDTDVWMNQNFNPNGNPCYK